MKKPEEHQPLRPVLGYRSKQDAAPPPPPLEPVLLCTPGLLCWLLLGIGWLLGDSSISLPGEAFWIMLLLAVITALVSIVRYGPRTHWWTGYVVFNLTANVIGLIFTTVMLLLVA